jgi:C4-dicarboxylate-specific signal transduction histidine kinase
MLSTRQKQGPNVRSEPYSASRTVRRWWAFTAVIASASLLLVGPEAVAADPKNVLVLYSHNRLLPALVAAESGLRETLLNLPDRPIELFTESLDVPRFSGEAYNRLVAAYLRDKYAVRPPDLIVAVSEESLAFLLHNRTTLFARVPIVHMAVQKRYLSSAGPMPVDVVGVPVEYSATSTVEDALRWHPKLQRLVVVTGAAAWDREWTARLHEELSQFQSRARVEFLSGLPTAELLTRLGELKGNAIVFTPGFFQDGAGRVFVPRDSVQMMAAAATAPVYAPAETYVGTGVVGGRAPSFRAMGQLAGRFADKLLRGAEPGSLVLPNGTPTELHVDWRQVRRWGIREDAIPADATVHFREPTLWEEQRAVVLVTIGVVLLQAALITALLLERQRRRRTAVALDESEQRMVLASNAAGLSMWIWDLGKQRVWATEPQRSDGEPPVRTTDFARAMSTVYPADRERVELAVRQALDTEQEFDVEYRVLRPDGEVRWKASRGRADPGYARLRGVTLDINDRKLAEMQAVTDRAALRHMTRVSLLGQLSASIAHQLYQPIAAALSNAEAAQEMLSHENVDLVELRAICDDIVAEEHRATDVISGIRALFRRGELQPKPIDLNTLVDETLALVQTDLVMRHVTPSTALTPSLPVIDGDRVQLQQVLLNLVLNAADAMSVSNGRGKLLTIRTDLVGSEVRVQVTDSGPGIAETDLKNVFDAFWTTKPEGIGIGLAVCQSIVATHRGSLTASNNPEGGATFSATFPMRASA